MNFKEFEGIFCNNSSKRKEITEEYKKHLSEIKNTGYFLDHWIGGSFVTTKENPSDIDTLTEFDGFEAEKNNEQAKIDDLIFNSKSKTKGLCHSLRIYRYPINDKLAYQYYLESKIRILIELYGSDRLGIPKGVIHLTNGEKNEI